MSVEFSDIMRSFFERTATEFADTPMGFMGSDFDPENADVWLEVSVLPNDPLHTGLRLDDRRVDRGIMQIAVVTKASPNGYFVITPLAQKIMEAFPIGYILTDNPNVGNWWDFYFQKYVFGRVARIVSEPSLMRVERETPDRIMLVVSMRYVT